MSISFDDSQKITYITTLSSIGAYETSSGNVIWQLSRKASTSAYDSGVLYIYEVAMNEMHSFTAFDANTSNELWSVEFNPSIRTEVYSLEILEKYLLAATNYGLLAMDKTSGKQIWKSDVDDKFSTRPVMINESIYARATASRIIYEISPNNGRNTSFIKLDKPPLLGLPDYEFNYAVMETDDMLIFFYTNSVFAYKK